MNHSPLRVLVVDDNETCAKTIGWTMEIFGHEMRLAHSGAEALRTAHEFAPQVILLDITLPDMTGYDICRALRRDPQFQHAVIIAQTGWTEEKHRALSMEAGFDYHLVKPVKIETLETILASIGQAKAA